MPSILKKYLDLAGTFSMAFSSNSLVSIFVVTQLTKDSIVMI